MQRVQRYLATTSCARALSLLYLGSLRQQVGLASNGAVLEIAGFPLLWVAGALFREEFARPVGVIAGALGARALSAALALLFTSACRRRR